MEYWNNYTVCTLVGEVWKTIPNYSRYQCSNYGRIRTPNWKGGNMAAIIKPAEDANGYLRTMLKRDDGKIHTIKIHRIVCQTFLPNPENKSTVNHIDCNPKNNCVDNLEWATPKEQSAHKVIMGNVPDFSGKNNPMYGMRGKDSPSSKEVYMFDSNGVFLKRFDTRKDAAEYVGRSSRTVCQAVETKTRCGGYYFWDTMDFSVPKQKHIKSIYAINQSGEKTLFTSIKLASESLNIDRSRISACLQKKQNQTSGYKFEYA